MILPWRNRRKPYSGLLGPAVFGSLAILVGLVLAYSLRKNHPVAGQTELVRPASVSASASAPQSRKVFPLSVIRGGAYTAKEFERARRTDRVVAAHYSGFGATPKFQRLTQDALLYVSYRRGDRVYWSKAKHRIAQGETVISDGNCLARARCGNRLSATPQGPVAPNEPAEEVLNTPETPEEPVSYKLVDFPGPAGRTFDMGLPSSIGGATPVSAAIPQSVSAPMVTGAFGVPGNSSAAGPIGFLGGVPSGGASPGSLSAKTPTQTQTTATTATLPVTNTGGGSLPVSSDFPGNSTVPVTTPGGTTGGLVPEPATFRYGALATILLVGLSLSRRLSDRALRS